MRDCVFWAEFASHTLVSCLRGEYLVIQQQVTYTLEDARITSLYAVRNTVIRVESIVESTFVSVYRRNVI